MKIQGKRDTFYAYTLICHRLSGDKGKSCDSLSISPTTLALPPPSAIPLLALQMCTLPKGQIPDSCFCLPISILSEFSWHSHWCPCSHFPDNFSIAPNLSHNPNYLQEMLTFLFQHNFDHVKNKQTWKTHCFRLLTGSPLTSLMLPVIFF